MSHSRQENSRPEPHRPHSRPQRLVSPLWDDMVRGCACRALSTSVQQLWTDFTIYYYKMNLLL